MIYVIVICHCLSLVIYPFSGPAAGETAKGKGDDVVKEPAVKKARVEDVTSEPTGTGDGFNDVQCYNVAMWWFVQ